MTNLQLISDALRAIGVINEVETPSAEQGQHALRRLNQMMEMWDEDGIKLGYFEQSSTAADCPIPKWAERGVTSKLAIDLQITYPGSLVTVELMDDEKNGYGMILRKTMVEGMKPSSTGHLPAGSGSYGSGYNIETDAL